MPQHDGKPEKISMTDILGPNAVSGGEDEVILVDTTGGDDPSSSDARLREAEAERQKYYDLYVRACADFENFRKRTERERGEESARAGAALMRELLPILDNLERAIAGGKPGDPLRDGIDLITRQVREALSKAGLSPIEALGEQFDPVFHEAVVTEQTDRFEPNTILEEAQKGYLLNGRVLRPSLVKVAVKPQGAARAAEDNDSGTVGED